MISKMNTNIPSNYFSRSNYHQECNPLLPTSYYSFFPFQNFYMPHSLNSTYIPQISSPLARDKPTTVFKKEEVPVKKEKSKSQVRREKKTERERLRNMKIKIEE